MACIGLLSFAMALPVHESYAQDAIGGAIIGGAAGGLLGGAIGGRRGVLPGVVIGAATGAIIASEGERRRGGYRYWRDGCYIQRADGSWVAVSPRYCDSRGEYYGPPPGPASADAIAYCQSRFRSYDPVSQTYMGFDGLRHPCP
jgi:hypothetical protein